MKKLVLLFFFLISHLLSAQTSEDTFITRWEITNDKDNIIIYSNGDYTYNYTLKWEMEDKPFINGEVTDHGKHIIENLAEGRYKVTISGEFPHFISGGMNEDKKNAAKLLSVEQWGSQRWKSMHNTFAYAYGLTSFSNDTPNLKEVKDMSRMFAGAENFNGDLSDWDVSKVRDMSWMFSGASSFNGDLSDWDVSKVTNMSSMFSGASSFNGDLSNWNVSRVTNMSWMFSGASSFNSDLSKWDVRSVTNMGVMFQAADSFNGDLSDWDVRSVTNMSWMFNLASKFTSDLSDWDVSSVRDMSNMFSNASSFNSDLSDWDVSKVRDMSRMFNNSGMSVGNYDATLIGWSELSSIPSKITLGALGLKYCAASSAREKLKEKKWNIERDKEDCSGTFFITRWEITNDKDNIIIYTNGNYTYNYTLKWEMEGEPSIKDGNLSTDGEVTAHGKRIIENLAKGKYKVTISGEFPHFLAGGHDYNPDSNNAAKLLSVEQWGTQQWKSMSKTFRSATNLTSFGNDTPNLQEVTDMSYMFNGASKFNSDLSKWDVSRVTNMSFMFSEASKFNSDLSDWDVSSVRDMSWMFQVANSFNGDLSDWDVSSVINMSWMFYGASSFNSDLSNWNVSSVTDMYSMFSGARKFTGNLSKWNISNVENMKEMFNNSGMSIADYDATLIGWSELSSIPSDITLGAKGLKYCAASSAREKLKEKNWNFVGDSKLGDNFVLEDKKIVYNGKSHSIEVTPAPTAPLEVTYQIYDSSNNVVNEAINVGVYRIEAKINGCVNEAILEITPASLKVEADAMTKTYGDADPLPFTYKVSGLQHSDTENQVLYGALSREQGENVGTYVIEQGTLLANGNYTLDFTDATLEIIPASLKVEADVMTKTYGDADPLPFTYKVSGLQHSDTENQVLYGALSREKGENVGTYVINQGTLLANDNYILDFTDAILTITPASLKVEADAMTKTYGEVDPPFLTYKVLGLQHSDTQDQVLYGALSREQGENVGTYAISQGTLLANDNYILDFTDATLEITSASLKVEADVMTKTYGDADPLPFTYKVSGLQHSDIENQVLHGALSREKGENVGTYVINQGTLLANGNYTLDFTGAILEITSASLKVDADAMTKTYGDVDPPLLTYKVSGLQHSDSQDQVLHGALSREQGENVGTYVISQGTLLADGNYTLDFTGATLEITPASLKVEADVMTKTYGDVDPPLLTYKVSGLQHSDTQDQVLHGALSREQGEDVGTYVIEQGTLLANDNYILDFIGADFIISKALITGVSFIGSTHTYDGKEKELLLLGDLPEDTTVIYTNNKQKDAGEYIVTALITGANYIDLLLEAKLVIEKAGQQITFEELSPVMYNKNGQLSLVASSSSGLPIRYTYLTEGSKAAATVSSDGVVTILSTGTIVITAHQDGDSNYLAANSISQTLRIINDEALITNWKINGKDKGVLTSVSVHRQDCNEIAQEVVIELEVSMGAVVSTGDKFILSTPKAGIYHQEIVVVSENRATTMKYEIVVERPFNFDDIVVQKFDNTLLVNNNPLTNGGYRFVGYKWYKNDRLISTEQAYSVGNRKEDLLDRTALYRVELMTDKGELLHSCSSTIDYVHTKNIQLYPNPVVKNGEIEIAIDYPQASLSQASGSVYSVTGKFLFDIPLSEQISKVTLPGNMAEGIYIMLIKIEGKIQTFRFMVKP